VTEVEKKYLSVRELSDFLGKGYSTVRGWIRAGRIKVKTRATAKSVFYRVTVNEAERVKRVIDSGMWV
jgi:predicted site-specific integrase-resolvase